jgi:hypothetical protein
VHKIADFEREIQIFSSKLRKLSRANDCISLQDNIFQEVKYTVQRSPEILMIHKKSEKKYRAD